MIFIQARIIKTSKNQNKGNALKLYRRILFCVPVNLILAFTADQRCYGVDSHPRKLQTINQ